MKYSKLIGFLGGRKCFQVTMFSVILEGIFLLSIIAFTFKFGGITANILQAFKFYTATAGTLVIGYVGGNVIQTKIEK